MLAVLTAVLLRFWRLGSWPPGLYRDEAFNGLDALGVLAGDHAIFFTANNGREPGYIYLTAVAISFLGRTPLAVRLAAAIVGTLTMPVVYLLGKSWFDRETAVYASWLWAITLWPVHLSRIGLRPILLPIMLALTLWIGTEAYRRRSNKLWLLAGLCYGLSFYTYLAVRLTPLLLLLILLYLWWHRWPLPTKQHALLFIGGATAVLLPLLIWIAQEPSRFLGRSNQVSILNPEINNGNLWSALWQSGWHGLGMFFWQGDNILRHNPAGRPVFDWVMALPFLIGAGVMLYRWKRPSHATLLLWCFVMLAPTILAEDTPHFLRAVGLLPAILYLPALGLTTLRQTLTPSPHHPRAFAIPILLLAASLILTLIDYRAYNQNPEVALLFESAALQLGEEIKGEDAETAVYLDRWFWDDEQGGWPSIPFIVDLEEVTMYRPELGVPLPDNARAVTIYGWPFGSIDFVPSLITPPATVSISQGAQARGDLEESAYPLYFRLHATAGKAQTAVAHFEDQFLLYEPTVWVEEDTMTVSLWWEAQTAVSHPWVIFVHLIGPDGLVDQDDAPPAYGLWQPHWWQPSLTVEDRHTLPLPPSFDPAQHQLNIGVYDPNTAVRLNVFAPNGTPLGDSYTFPLHEQP